MKFLSQMAKIGLGLASIGAGVGVAGWQIDSARQNQATDDVDYGSENTKNFIIAGVSLGAGLLVGVGLILNVICAKKEASELENAHLLPPPANDEQSGDSMVVHVASEASFSFSKSRSKPGSARSAMFPVAGAEMQVTPRSTAAETRGVLQRENSAESETTFLSCNSGASSAR